MDEHYMKLALKLSKKAQKNGDVPVGALIVKDDKILARGYNKREKRKNALYHAEIIAIDKACKKIKSWHLKGCTLYVTLKPCPMCAGAIINARLDRIVFGTKDYKAGAFGSVFDVNKFPLNHRPTVTEGVCLEECSKLLSDFFKKLRLRGKRFGKGSELF